MSVALYWDWQNIRATGNHIAQVLNFAGSQGCIKTKLACAQWKKEPDCHGVVLHRLGFDCLHVPDGRNNADQKLINHCRHLAETSTLQTVVLISNDGDFVPLIRELKLKGIRVIVIGTSHCNKRLKKLSHEYYCISTLV
jgi:uncharacterized Zn ribbon protein